MPKKLMLTYNGVTQCKQDWAKTLGLSVSSFSERVKKYYPHNLERCFNPYYLDMEHIIPRQIVVQKELLKDSAKQQRKLDKLTEHRRFLKDLQKDLQEKLNEVDLQIEANLF